MFVSFDLRRCLKRVLSLIVFWFGRVELTNFSYTQSILSILVGYFHIETRYETIPEMINSDYLLIQKLSIKYLWIPIPKKM